MDFERLIEMHACLKDYFAEFPKKLQKLAAEGKVIKFNNNAIEIDPNLLSNYLLSKESVFPIKTVMDFFETLQVLQFSKYSNSRHKMSYIFINPNFGKDIVIEDDFYKQAIDIMKVNELKNTKRMSPTHFIDLFNRLINLHNNTKIKMTKLEFARYKQQFLLHQLVDSKKCEEYVVGHEIKEPDYAKNNEIAGYYGDVELSALKKVFRNYFPIYPEDVDMTVDQVVPEKAPESNSAQDTEMINVDQIIENPVEEIAVPEMPVLKPIETVQQAENPPIIEVAQNDCKENQPPPKKRRKYTSRASKITIKETNDALLNLQKEFDGL